MKFPQIGIHWSIYGFTIHHAKYVQVEEIPIWVKHGPPPWYVKIDSYIQKLGFLKSDANSNLYFKVVENQPLVLVLYVDDIFLTGEEKLIAKCQRELALEFQMKYLDLMY